MCGGRSEPKKPCAPVRLPQQMTVTKEAASEARAELRRKAEVGQWSPWRPAYPPLSAALQLATLSTTDQGLTVNSHSLWRTHCPAGAHGQD